MESQLATGRLVKVWQGVYSDRPPDRRTQLRGLDLRIGETVISCLHTAAEAYGFDTEEKKQVHVLTPGVHLLRSTTGLVVHRRIGAPLTTVADRPVTEPNWTAVEVARALRRPRALATLDAALRSKQCDRVGLQSAVEKQRGRRGIAHVRELVALADRLAESPMESEARLVMYDARLPAPVLQHPIVDHDGITWHVDFAWPAVKLAVEYDGFEFHSEKKSFRRDRRKKAALQELGWRVMSIVDDDVRRTPQRLVRQIQTQLDAT